MYLDCLVVVYHFIKMKLQNINAKPIRKYILKDYRLVYKGRADDYAYLTIEKCDGSVVPLGVFEISYFDIIPLEAYEGYPIFYKKIYLPLQIGEKKEGYNDFGFDKQNLENALIDTKNNMSKSLIKKYQYYSKDNNN